MRTLLIICYGMLMVSMLCSVVSFFLSEEKGKNDRNSNTDSGYNNAGNRPIERFFVCALFAFGGMSFLWFIAVG